MVHSHDPDPDNHRDSCLGSHGHGRGIRLVHDRESCLAGSCAWGRPGGVLSASAEQAQGVYQMRLTFKLRPRKTLSFKTSA